MIRVLFSMILCGLCLILTSCTSPWKTNTIYNTETSREVAIFDVASSVPTGGVAILVGQRDFEPFTENQNKFLNELTIVSGNPVSVGLSFLDRSDQTALDQYLAGNIAGEELVKTTHWGSRKFALYETQILFPRDYRGQTIALGARRTLKNKMEAGGLSSLNTEDRELLPPGFKLGEAPVQGAKTSFEAQAYENDFAAYIITEYLKLHPEQRLVVLADESTPAFGGALEERLRKRGVKSVIVIAQSDFSGRSLKEEAEILSGKTHFGPKPRYFWIERR